MTDFTSGNSQQRGDVTVIIPAFNRGRLITRALDSVARQTRAPAQIIVVDDASTDDTPEIVIDWGNKHPIPVRLERLPENSGPATARNQGIALSQTALIAFLDSDDEYKPCALQRLALPLEHLPNAVLSFSDATVMTETKEHPHGLFSPHAREVSASEIVLIENNIEVRKLISPVDALLKASIIPTSATCFRKTAALHVGGMPPSFRFGEDWLFWLLLSQEGDFIFQMDDLTIHNRHSQNSTHPSTAARISNEKLRGYANLMDGSLGVPLNEQQKSRLLGLHASQCKEWRYQHSLTGLRSYLSTLSAGEDISGQSVFKQLLIDPKSVIRALFASARELTNPNSHSKV